MRPGDGDVESADRRLGIGWFRSQLNDEQCDNR